MRNMSRPLAESFEGLSSDTSGLHGRWMLYRQLFGTSKVRIELLNHVAPYFFHELQRVLVDAVILTICRLTDQPNTGSQSNLVLRTLRSHLDPTSDAALIVDLDQRLQQMDLVLRPLRASRNKRIAHKDLPIALDPHAPALPGVSRAHVEEALAAIRGYLNAVQAYFSESETGYQYITAASDGEALIHALKRAVNHERLEESLAVPWDWLAQTTFGDA